MNHNAVVLTSELMRYFSHFVTTNTLPHQGNKTRLGHLHSYPAGMSRAGVIKTPNFYICNELVSLAIYCVYTVVYAPENPDFFLMY